MIKRILMLLLLVSPALAQLGYRELAIPGWSPGNSAATFYVCGVSTSDATCISSPDVTIYSDVAAVSQITQPMAVSSRGSAIFYAQPGTYRALIVTTAPGGVAGNTSLTFVVPPDVAGNVALADGYAWISARSCTFAQGGTGGGANGTYALEGSVLSQIAQSTDGGTNTLTCPIVIPTRTTAGKGAVIQNIDVHYGITLHAATSIGTATLGSYTAPAAGATETPSSATLVASFCGTLTQSSSTGNLAVVTAGQFYTNRITCGTPAQMSDRQVLVLVWTIADSNSETFLTYVSGLGVHYKINQQ